MMYRLTRVPMLLFLAFLTLLFVGFLVLQGPDTSTQVASVASSTATSSAPAATSMATSSATSTEAMEEDGATLTEPIATTTASSTPDNTASSTATSTETLSMGTATSSGFTLVPAAATEAPIVVIDPNFDPFEQAMRAQVAYTPKDSEDCFAPEARERFGNPRSCFQFLATEPE